MVGRFIKKRIMKKEEIENWEGKIYDFLSPVNLTMFREERTEKVISFVKELLKSEKEKWLEKIDEIIDDNNDLLRWQEEELKDEIKKELKVGGN